MHGWRRSGLALEPGIVAVVGLPYDGGSPFLRGAAAAPAEIRDALRSTSSNMATESGRDLGRERRFQDLGDLDLADNGDDAFREVEETVGEILDRGARVLSLGGDHSLAWPILRAYGRRFEGLHVLQLDAHPDLYDELDGSRTCNACPFVRVLEEGLVARLVQVGIRTMNPHQQRQAERFGVEVIPMALWYRARRPEEVLATIRRSDPPAALYLSLDLDVIDPAGAPGVSHPEPGGASVRDVVALLQALDAPLVGADIVELNPRRDGAGLTARVAAKLLKEVAERMLVAG